MYVMYMAYDIPNDTIFKKRVDASFETFKGKDLQFQISSSIPFNSPIITNDRSEEYFNSLFASENEWSPIYLQDIHDYHREINVFIPEEGCYEFRLKLYQTENDTTFYSPKYRLDVVKKNFEYDPDATQPAEPLERPDAPSDPEWGKTSYRPQLSNVARRASLFDLPDPSASETDPFATDPNGTRVRTADDAAAPVESQFEVLTGTPQVEPLGTTDADDDHGAEKPKRSLLGRLRGKGQSDGEDSDDGRTWRGGAATRGDLRLVEDGEQPSEGDLRDAVLSLGDDALVAHDIWFVALGGSALDHAGMQAFLARHRSEIRGCFIVNLDCVGAGRLVALKNEGREETRRADRRMMRLLGGVAGDLHVQLGQETHDWADTDATPAMRSSLRAVTLMGVDESGLPALSRTPEDTIENVSGDQASQVAAIVTEMIRRS